MRAGVDNPFSTVSLARNMSLSMSARASFLASVLLSMIPIACASVQAGETTLQKSTWDGATAQTKKPLASAPDHLEKTENQWTPLYTAIDQSRFEDAKVLLGAGADPNVEVDDGYPNGRRCLIQVAVNRFNAGIIKALLDAGAKVDHVDASGQQPIHAVTEWGTPEMLKLLLAAGAKLDAQIKGKAMDSRNGDQPIHLAAIHGNTEMVKALIALGADVNAKNACGNTVVKEVVYGGCDSNRLATLKVLLEAHADPNTADSDDRTPIDFAGFYGESDAIRLLLAAGAKPSTSSLAKQKFDAILGAVPWFLESLLEFGFFLVPFFAGVALQICFFRRKIPLWIGFVIAPVAEGIFLPQMFMPHSRNFFQKDLWFWFILIWFALLFAVGLQLVRAISPRMNPRQPQERAGRERLWYWIFLCSQTSLVTLLVCSMVQAGFGRVYLDTYYHPVRAFIVEDGMIVTALFQFILSPFFFRRFPILALFSWLTSLFLFIWENHPTYH